MTGGGGRGEIVRADLTWTGERFERGVAVEVDGEGRIARVARDGHVVRDGADDGPPVRRLRHRALLPGFVNVHSHAFQRGLRGRGEAFPAGAGDFWLWREEMYSLVARIYREQLYEVTLAAFREMRAAGITTVGEFHYLHHDDPDDADFAFDEVILEAAAAAPIRIALLEVFYASGGIRKPLTGAQERFATPTVDGYWRQVDLLEGMLAADGGQTLGAVAHSVRAASPEQIAELHGEARRRGMPFHMHVEEQKKEIEACRLAYRKTPMGLLLDRLDVGEEFTAVHCTHTDPGELARYAGAGGNVCVCPLTEANLGDGVPPLRSVPATLDRICLGTDSNARISMLEEIRWLEYGQRLAGGGRGALRDGRGRLGPVLLAAATRNGARALGVESGAIAAGRWADLVAVSLEHPQLAHADEESLLEALLLGCDERVIAATAVGGRWQEHGTAGDDRTGPS